MSASGKRRYITTEAVEIPAGVVVELTKKQAEALGESVEMELAQLRNDLGVQIPAEDKVLPEEEE